MKIKNISQYVLDFIENNQNEDIKEKWTSKKNLKAFEKIILKTSVTEKIEKPVKRAKTSYLIFCDENRASVIEDNPTFTSSQIITELGIRWNNLKKENPSKIKEYQQKSSLAKENLKNMLIEKQDDNLTEKNDISKNIVVEPEPDSEDDKIIEIKKKPKTGNKVLKSIDSDSNTDEESNKKSKDNASAFENYFNKRKDKIKEKYPYLNEEGILKKLTKKWKHLPDEKKNKF